MAPWRCAVSWRFMLLQALALGDLGLRVLVGEIWLLRATAAW
jgi:hypothetical protein